MVELFINLLICVFLIIVAYWRQDSYIYVIAGSLTTYFGISLIPTVLIAGLAVSFFGLYTIARAFMTNSWGR